MVKDWTRALRRLEIPRRGDEVGAGAGDEGADADGGLPQRRPDSDRTVSPFPNESEWPVLARNSVMGPGSPTFARRPGRPRGSRNKSKPPRPPTGPLPQAADDDFEPIETFSPAAPSPAAAAEDVQMADAPEEQGGAAGAGGSGLGSQE